MNSAPLHGRIVFYWFFGFFVLIVTVNMVMAVLATRTHSGVIRGHAYQEGLEYNRVIAATEAQSALGWQADVVLGMRAIDVTMHDASGALLRLDLLHAEINRPLEGALQQQAVLHAVQAGQYHADIQLPKHGVWDVRLRAVRGEDTFQFTKRVVIQ